MPCQLATSSLPFAFRCRNDGFEPFPDIGRRHILLTERYKLAGVRMIFNEQKVRKALHKAWSLDTAVQWTEENPASGQCNVTTAVICDMFGGEVLRTKLGGVWHYYNRINGERRDLTDSQFTAPGALFDTPEPYHDEVSSVDEAMNGIPMREYNVLKQALLRELGHQ